MLPCRLSVPSLLHDFMEHGILCTQTHSQALGHSEIDKAAGRMAARNRRIVKEVEDCRKQDSSNLTVRVIDDDLSRLKGTFEGVRPPHTMRQHQLTLHLAYGDTV
jgi:hypothetical protein